MPVFDPDNPNQENHTMKFTYKSEDDAKKELLLPPGIYDFEVIEAEDTFSKRSGKEMLKLKLRIFAGDGERHVFDYLMESMRFKLIHFCQAAGLWDKYEAGEMTAEYCKGRCGKVQLIVEEQEGYQPKNSVKDYVKSDAVAAAPAAPVATTIKKPAPAPAPVDDGVPF